MKKHRQWPFPNKNVSFSPKRLNRVKRQLLEKEPELAKTPDVLDQKARTLL